MKLNSILSLFIALSFLILGNAEAAPFSSQDCSDAGISALKLSPMDQDSKSPPLVNFCIHPELAPESVQKAFATVKTLNTKIADYFGMSVSAVFTEKLEVVFDINPTGFYPSSFTFATTTSAAILDMGVFSDFDGSFNQGVYVHEVGHYLNAASSSPAIPVFLKSLGEGPIFSEMIADLLAREVNGVIVDVDASLPQCFSRTRFISAGQTYKASANYFDTRFTMRRMSACCASSIKDPLASEKVKTLCGMISFQSFFAPELPAWNPEFLSVKTVMNFDPHQIGIPLQSFFKALEDKTKVKTKDLMLRAFRAKAKRKFMAHYQCQAEGGAKEKVARASVRKLLAFIQREIKHREDQKTFEALWDHFGISVLLEISDSLEIKKLEVDRAYEEFKDSKHPMKCELIR